MTLSITELFTLQKIISEYSSFDISMPDMSGIDVLGRIRNIEKEKFVSKEKQVKILSRSGILRESNFVWHMKFFGTFWRVFSLI